jgi:hypothetical protein
VQLFAPPAYRGRVLSFFLVALGVSYPIGTLVQGRIADTIGVGWTTVASALALSLVMAVAAAFRPGFRQALVGREPPRALAEPAEPVPPPAEDVQMAP